MNNLLTRALFICLLSPTTILPAVDGEFIQILKEMISKKIGVGGAIIVTGALIGGKMGAKLMAARGEKEGQRIGKKIGGEIVNQARMGLVDQVTMELVKQTKDKSGLVSIRVEAFKKDNLENFIGGGIGALMIPEKMAEEAVAVGGKIGAEALKEEYQSNGAAIGRLVGGGLAGMLVIIGYSPAV